MNATNLWNNMLKTFTVCLDLSKKKNADYASHEDPFANFRGVEDLGICTVEEGILVRLSDKFKRICNLIANGKRPEVDDESIDDTIRDAINYLAILKAYRDREKFVDCHEVDHDLFH